jgi:predicted Zn finger-like uncharacterized protein
MIVSCPSCQRNYVVADEQIAGKQFRARCKSCGVEFRLDGMGARAASNPPTPNEPAKFMSATERFLALQSTPPPNAASWSVCLSQTDTRRMSTDEIVQAVLKGTIKSAVFVWKTGMSNWLRLTEVPEIVTAITKAGGRVPQARSTAEPKHPVGTASASMKPAPPARQQTLMSQPPPVPTPSVLPARSGQTMPPPSMGEQAGSSLDASSEVKPAAASSSADVKPEDTRTVDTKPQTNAGAKSTDASASSTAPQHAETAGTTTHAVPNPESALSVAAGGAAVRRNTPAPPLRRNTQDIPIEIEVPMPPDPAVPSPAIVLPPLQGKESDAASTALAASAPASATDPKHVEQRDVSVTPKAAASESMAATSNSKPPPAGTFDSPLPSKPKKSVVGVIVAMGAIGLVGVLGGVAGAVYVMKSAMGIQPGAAPATNVVVLQPQAATPSVSVAAAAVAAPSPPPADTATQSEHAEPSERGSENIADRSASATTAASRNPASAAVGRPAPPKTSKASEAKSPVANPTPALPPPADKVAKESSTPPPANAGPFNRDAAMAVLGVAATRASSCKRPDGPTGTAKVHVTFDPSGTVVIANIVGSPIAGTPVAQCLAGLFRRIKVPPFSGDRASLSRDVTIAP